MVLKLDYKMLLKNLSIPLITGIISAFLTRGGVRNFTETVNKPAYSPPDWLFPIVWTILYILMGIAAYVVESNTEAKNNKGFVFYYLQLFFNFLWSFIFFNSQNYLVSFIWIIILLALIILTATEFYKINKIAAYLLVPYIIWVAFASVLNFSIYLLN